MQATVQELGWWVASDGNWYPPEQRPQTDDPSAGPVPPAVTPAGPQGPQVSSRTVAFFGSIGIVVLAAMVLVIGFGRGTGDPCGAVDLAKVREITKVVERTVEPSDEDTCVIEGTIGEYDPDDLFPATPVMILVSTHEGLSAERQASIADEFERTDVSGVTEGNEAWTFPDEAWVRNGDLWIHVTIDADNLVNHETDAALVADAVLTNR